MGASGFKKVQISGLMLIIGALMLLMGAPLAHASDMQGQALVPGVTDLTDSADSSTTCRTATVSSGSVTWDAATRTITMKNAVINLDAQGSSKPNYAVSIDGRQENATPTVTLKLVGKNTIQGGDSKSLWAAVYTNQANLTIAGTGSLSIATPKAQYASVYVDGALKASAGAVNVTGGDLGIYATKSVTVSGASLAIKKAKATGIQSGGLVKLAKGSVTINGSGEQGIYADSNITLSGATVSVSNAGSYAIYANKGSFTAQAGTLKVNSCAKGVFSAKTLVLKGKTTKVNMNKVGDTGVRSTGLTCSAGTLSVSQCKTGIYSEGTVAISGGTVSVSKASEVGIQAQGAALKITGGSVSALCTKDNAYALYATKGIGNTASSLKKVRGVLGKGATFVVGGNTYAVTGDYTVSLKSYGSKLKAATVNTVKFGVNYQVREIAANAFNTISGRAVTSVVLGSNVQTIGAKAFYKTAKLAKMVVKRSASAKWKLSKNAFTQCGKKAGKALTVTCWSSNDVKKMRLLFVGHGMSKKAKFA